MAPDYILKSGTGWDTHPGGSGDAFPVGSVFLSVVATDPATLLGYGTWAQIAQGKMLVGQDVADPDFDTAEEAGGAKTHLHADNLSHSGTAVAAHAVTQPSAHSAHSGTAVDAHGVTQPSAHGSHAATNHLPPYFTVYAWKRTA